MRFLSLIKSVTGVTKTLAEKQQQLIPLKDAQWTASRKLLPSLPLFSRTVSPARMCQIPAFGNGFPPSRSISFSSSLKRPYKTGSVTFIIHFDYDWDTYEEKFFGGDRDNGYPPKSDKAAETAKKEMDALKKEIPGIVEALSRKKGLDLDVTSPTNDEGGEGQPNPEVQVDIVLIYGGSEWMDLDMHAFWKRVTHVTRRGLSRLGDKWV